MRTAGPCCGSQPTRGVAMEWHRSSAGSARTHGRRRGRILAATVGAVSLLGLSANAPVAGAQAGGTPNLTATPLTVDSVVDGARSASGRAAKTDPSLLGLTSADPVPVMVKLDYDPLATYSGDIEGLQATSPSVTGQRLDVDSTASQAYSDYVEGVESDFLGALDTAIPAAEAGQPVREVYGGLPVEVPGNKISQLLKLPNVAAVQADTPQQLLTDSSPEFIGATGVYPQLGGVGNSGAGIIVGVLDTGAWPEHPGYADPGNLPAPPPKADGTPRTCNFGDNPLTPAVDVFVCNHKLIGGQPFLATYNAVFGDEPLPTSARDSEGHGTHTSTTAAGGQVADANPLGISRGPIHGIAPGASIIMYKVCGPRGCFNSDTVRAQAQAIRDGVDVVNFSVGGGADPYADPVELGFLDLYASGTFVAASAGNSGPGAGTTDHNGPWVTTVA